MFFVSLVIVLVVGDLASTFLYHVPQHLWFKLHLRTHHDRSRSYWDHAVLSKDPAVMLDGFLGAVPYLIIAGPLCLLGTWSAVGAVLGLVLGQLHVWWRHTTDLGWVSPPWLVRLCRALAIVLPEDHDGHHRNPDVEFGDIFRFYDAPARAFMKSVRSIQRRRRTALRRLERIRALRLMRTTQRA
ncbi:MAG: sterol desaturase family protein [Candidatus Eremiobacteraeota bacterium]|nr:sterol desaturase family protein [Candidatus Eremiobacteraeota bacterium]MBC5802410.1 sterol desaturase family protein [Candidatus Eremiobacteraeota bacterium]